MFASPTAEATGALAALVAGTGFVEDSNTRAILVSGDVGGGKTTFVRALLRALAADPTLPVPSPTFALAHEYEVQAAEVVRHVDLYRLGAEAVRSRLGLPESFKEATYVVEWPDRLNGGEPADRLDVLVELDGPSHGLDEHVRDRDEPATRKITLTAFGRAWRRRLAAVSHAVERFPPDRLAGLRDVSACAPTPDE